MRSAKSLCILSILFISIFSLAKGALASQERGSIQFKAGEVGFIPFLEMVSDKLDIQIDASGLGSSIGSVVLPETGSLNLEDAKALILSTLYLQGYTWIFDSSHDLYRIVSMREARDQEIPMIADKTQLPKNDLLVTYTMPTHHVSPEYIARVIRSFMPANSRIIPDVATQSVWITDSARNISKLEKLIQQLDTPQTAKQSAEWLSASMKKTESSCPVPGGEGHPYRMEVLIALFSLIFLVIGFLSRGYVIRRIEGGL